MIKGALYIFLYEKIDLLKGKILDPDDG